jgi:glycosyltransferase involved in cell wall biosynthesis
MNIDDGMNEYLLISIAMATYNGQKYLKEQLDSIYAQTYKNIEVIVADDCSTDETVKILNEYSISYGLKYYKNEQNLGYVKNFEKAITLCSGDFIALCDQDDVWRADKLEKMFKNIAGNLLIHSDAKLIDENGDTLSESYAAIAHKKFRKNTYEYFFSNDVTGCTTLFKKELLFFALPFPKNMLAHDWWLALCASKEGSIKYLNEPLISYRQHASNQIGAADISKVYPHELRARAYQKTLFFLESLYDAKKWNKKEMEVLKNLIIYYQAYFNDAIRFKSLYIHINYFKHFYNDKSMPYRVIGLCLSLFGEKLQQKMWRLVGR